MERLLQVFMFPKRIKFRWRNRNRRKVTETLIKTLKSRFDEASRAELPTYMGIYNVGLFTALLEQDLSAYSEAIFFARSEWHRQFFARGMAVLLYEGAKDMSILLGKEYRQCLNKLGLAPNWTAKLNEITGQLSRFRKSHDGFLKEVRNYVGAHRDHNASAQLDVMADFKAIRVYELGAEFSEPLRDLVEFYKALLTYIHNPAVMMLHVAKTMD